MSTLCETRALHLPVREHGKHFRRRKNHRKTLFACSLVCAVACALLGAMLCSMQGEALSALYSADPGAYTGPAHTVSGVPYLSQNGEFPTGCEAVSAVMLLNFYDVEITAGEFIDEYLPLGDAPHTDGSGRLVGYDPWKEFPGDPRTEQGWGCYAPVIERAMNRCLSGSTLYAEYLEGVPLSKLCTDYIDNGVPVLVWATIDMEAPSEDATWLVPESGREITWVYPMHCLVLTGYDNEHYIFSDPLVGESIAYDKEAVETAYKAQHEQAVVVE